MTTANGGWIVIQRNINGSLVRTGENMELQRKMDPHFTYITASLMSQVPGSNIN